MKDKIEGLRNMLENEGSEIASFWNGSCSGFEIDKEKREVVFKCIEHGEKFITSSSFDELLAKNKEFMVLFD